MNGADVVGLDLPRDPARRLPAGHVDRRADGRRARRRNRVRQRLERRPGVALRVEALLEDLGLANALRELCTTFSATAGLRIERRISRVLPPLSPQTELVLYRVAQESLTNALRHPHATRVELRLERVPGGVVLRVTDDGRGLPDGVLASSVGGLRGMQEWALLVGAQLDVSSRQPGGVQVRLRVRALDEAEGCAA